MQLDFLYRIVFWRERGRWRILRVLDKNVRTDLIFLWRFLRSVVIKLYKLVIHCVQKKIQFGDPSSNQFRSPEVQVPVGWETIVFMNLIVNMILRYDEYFNLEFVVNFNRHYVDYFGDYCQNMLFFCFFKRYLLITT